MVEQLQTSILKCLLMDVNLIFEAVSEEISRFVVWVKNGEISSYRGRHLHTR